MGYRIVVVGATGNVGREMLNILAERQFPIDEIAAVASSRSHGISRYSPLGPRQPGPMRRASPLPVAR